MKKYSKPLIFSDINLKEGLIPLAAAGLGAVAALSAEAAAIVGVAAGAGLAAGVSAIGGNDRYRVINLKPIV